MMCHDAEEATGPVRNSGYDRTYLLRVWYCFPELINVKGLGVPGTQLNTQYVVPIIMTLGTVTSLHQFLEKRPLPSAPSGKGRVSSLEGAYSFPPISE